MVVINFSKQTCFSSPTNSDIAMSCLYLIQQFLHPPCSVVDLCFHSPLPFLFFGKGMLNCLNPVFKISHIVQAYFLEFVIDSHYYMSLNQQEEPPTLSFSHSEPLPDDASPAQLPHICALHHCPYLPFTSMVRLLDSQSLPRLRKTYMNSIFLQTLLSLESSRIMLSSDCHCPLFFI
jgi:hypothetical protein